MKTRTFLTLATLAALASFGSAQSRFSQTVVGAANTPNINYGFLDFANSDTGAPLDRSFSRTFTGLDSQGASRDMTIASSLSASAEFGRMHAALDVSISNIYYNPANAPFVREDDSVDEEGSPDQFVNNAFAGFKDELKFGGVSGGGYSVKYVFFVEGRASGSGVSADVVATVGSNPFEDLKVDITGPYTTPIGQYLSTRSYAVADLQSELLDVYFTTQFNPYFGNLPDGSTLAGKADFSSTASLAAVLLYDASGNLATNYTVTGKSGTSYPVAPVPEPASLAALGLGALALLRRRKA